ncbi:hypothetical protein GCM10007857_43340 [Bradyrhizobium iriomotense]|uniref:Uncharacterized protein n=1 Tax=Bradyrhizobium iriomotense TaxID=441950 RepID=A0ABQ6B5Y8_9BRAD|nr:hypothetical protein GCM10007857_43340 [Bradyrhizobium iriomotense]
MRWLHWNPTRADILGILFALVLVYLCAFIAVRFPLFRQPTGFGPDWDCHRMPKGDPVCTKRLDR